MPVDNARSRNMSAVRRAHTKPELTVRRAAHSLGLRFRLFRSDLPGRPDMTFSKWRTVLFVNGCFWHQHSKCPRAKLPKTNREFWKRKLKRNAARDQSNYHLLMEQGWRVVVIWECELSRSNIREVLRVHFRTGAVTPGHVG